LVLETANKPTLVSIIAYDGIRLSVVMQHSPAYEV